jgi:hypothetical protein
MDNAMLFCGLALEQYYGASGWETMPAPTWVGAPGAAHQHEASKMMLFVSEMGHAANPNIAVQGFGDGSTPVASA